jgi:hypothetical protein
MELLECRSIIDKNMNMQRYQLKADFIFADSLKLLSPLYKFPIMFANNDFDKVYDSHIRV